MVKKRVSPGMEPGVPHQHQNEPCRKGQRERKRHVHLKQCNWKRPDARAGTAGEDWKQERPMERQERPPEGERPSKGERKGMDRKHAGQRERKRQERTERWRKDKRQKKSVERKESAIARIMKVLLRGASEVDFWWLMHFQELTENKVFQKKAPKLVTIPKNTESHGQSFGF